MNALNSADVAERLSALQPEYSGWTRQRPEYEQINDKDCVYGQVLFSGRQYECRLTQAWQRNFTITVFMLYIRVCEKWWDPGEMAKAHNGMLYHHSKGRVGLVGFGSPDPSGWFCVSCLDGIRGVTGSKLLTMHELSSIVVPELAALYSAKGWERFHMNDKPFSIVRAGLSRIPVDQLSGLSE